MIPERMKPYVPHIVPSVVTSFVLGGVLIYAFSQIWSLQKEVISLTASLASTTGQLNTVNTTLTQGVTELDKKTQGLSTQLSNTKQNIEAVKDVVGGVQQSVGTINSTVGTLKKLSETDPAYLKKYSKVYFLNENYTPAHLIQIPKEYTYTETRKEQFVTEAYPKLFSLIMDAKQQGVTLYVKSAYRSFTEQKSLKSAYSVTYGKGTANAFSAEQGFSEHQLGTAVDFITTGTGGNLDGFEKTSAYLWLQNNAHKYGFIISYPKGNTYYIFEPWHWRYVGVKLATYLHDTKKTFYDVDQRDIDKYLINFFD
jgi:D-alanyl-D-alanine carboxypeptidase